MGARPKLPTTPAPAPWRPDIAALPTRTAPYPNDVPLDPEEVKSALWHARGNLRAAAGLLWTSQARLGALVKRDATLAATRQEAAELLLDEAEAVMVEALTSEDPVRADAAARFVLERAGRGRGWTRDGSTGVSLSFGNAQGGALAVKWQTE